MRDPCSGICCESLGSQHPGRQQARNISLCQISWLSSERQAIRNRPPHGGWGQLTQQQAGPCTLLQEMSLPDAAFFMPVTLCGISQTFDLVSAATAHPDHL